MKRPIIVKSQDAILEKLHFKPYRSTVERRVRTFIPDMNEPQSMEVMTPWGEALTAVAGDFLVSELNAPDDYWPVKPEIFDDTYIIVRPGYCVKSALTYLVPLTDLTDGDEDANVTVHSIEGANTVRAGDFYLARGVKGEIWAYPKAEIGQVLELVDET
jgi:hypothetical protein